MSQNASPNPSSTTRRCRPRTLLSLLVVPVFSVALLFHFDSLDPAELPIHELTGPPAVAPMVNNHILHGSERIGVGNLPAPEDIAYDANSGVIFTGCSDGWIKRVTVRTEDVVVEDWVDTGGRPLGLAIGIHKDLIVTDTEKGLLQVTQEGVVELLTDEAEAVKFKLVDGVDVAQNGIIYFTDASHKYSLNDSILDILEGRPNGRFMSYDPTTKQTLVLVRDLYFANGVAVSPNQDFVVFCETVMSRCKRYYIEGSKKGTVDTFVEHLPGLPDNIRYDGEGQFWIGIATGITPFWKIAIKYPWVRKVSAILAKYGKRPNTEKDGGAFVVDLEGNPIAHYYDHKLSHVTCSVKIGNFMYLGSLYDSFITRLDLAVHGAQ